jgi:small conductance mechanosensitive channel
MRVSVQYFCKHIFVLTIVAIFVVSYSFNTMAEVDTSLKAVGEDETSQPAEKNVIERVLPEIEIVERVISLEEPQADSKIQQRLEKILLASNKYTDFVVQVNNGVVELTGTTTEKKYIEWASDIARNVEGVVALINNIQVQRTGNFTIAYLKKEIYYIWLSVLDLVPRVIIGFLVLLFFSLISSPLSSWLMTPLNRKNSSHLIHLVLRRAISLFLMLIGVYFFLRIAGLTQFALAIISGTGVIGLILGFAFRDIAENFIASLLISVQRPFRLGDVIQVQGHLGVVQKVTARGTTLVDYDGNHIQIPNAIVYKNIIQNLSANPRLRGKFIIGIGYDASIKLAQDLGVKLMQDHHAVLNDPEPQVLVDSLGASTIVLKVYFWVNSETHSVLKVSSILMRLIMREYEKHGITMPDDAREIIFPQGVPIVTGAQAQIESLPANALTDKNSSETSSSTSDALKEKQAVTVIEQDSIHGVASDDLSSDTDNIRDQATQARAPEEGKNIL